MRSAEAFLLTYAANAVWMTCLIAALSAGISLAMRRTPASHHHIMWTAALWLSLLLPLAATRFAVKPPIRVPPYATAPSAGTLESVYTAIGEAPASLPLTTPLMNTLLAAYLAFIVVRVGRLARAWRWSAAICRGPLIQVADVKVPFTTGIRRSVIVLPRSLAGRSRERRAAIAHERAHVRRHDFLFNVINEVVLIPLGWHPGALFIKSRIDQTRELACDDVASRAPAAYAEMLLKLAEAACAAPHSARPLAISMFDSDSLEKRIRNLLDHPKRMDRQNARLLLGFALTVLVAVSLGAATHAIRIAAAGDTSSFAGHWIADFHGPPLLLHAARSERRRNDLQFRNSGR